MDISFFSDYYVWAENRIIESLVKITDEKLFKKKIEPNGRSIRDMVEHIATSYEMIFNTPKSQEEYTKFIDRISELSWSNLIDYWKKWLNKFAEIIDQDSFPIPRNFPIEIKSKDDYIFAYSDHSTYHRGQLVILINLTGEKALNTDYFTFLMEKDKNNDN
ncbi:MAG: DinB family protein [Candidatus Hodarchaeota archaeon]